MEWVHTYLPYMLIMRSLRWPRRLFIADHLLRAETTDIAAELEIRDFVANTRDITVTFVPYCCLLRS
jgi:hypothetical protein